MAKTKEQKQEKIKGTKKEVSKQSVLISNLRLQVEKAHSVVEKIKTERDKFRGDVVDLKKEVKKLRAILEALKAPKKVSEKKLKPDEIPKWQRASYVHLNEYTEVLARAHSMADKLAPVVKQLKVAEERVNELQKIISSFDEGSTAVTVAREEKPVSVEVEDVKNEG